MHIKLEILTDDSDDVVDILDVLSHAKIDACGVRRFTITTHVPDTQWLTILARELHRRTFTPARTCEVWTGLSDEDGAVACGKPATHQHGHDQGGTALWCCDEHHAAIEKGAQKERRGGDDLLLH